MDKKEKKITRGSKKDFDYAYKIIYELGTGAASVVYECKGLEKHGRYAVKISDIEAIDMELLQAEFDIMYDLDHENLVKAYEMFITDDKVYTILELVEGGELHDIVNSEGNLSESDAVAIAVQLVQAVYYLHDRNISHRDIKPENILLCNDGTLKLTDFGLAVQLKGDELMTRCVGTQAYQAPEVLLGLPYNRSVDMWAIGATLFTIMSGEKPFPSDLGKDTQRAKILNAEFDFSASAWKSTSKDARDFISKLLKVKPTDRMTSNEAMQHSWLQCIDLREFNRSWFSKSRARKSRLRELASERRRQERTNSQLSGASSGSGSARSSRTHSSIGGDTEKSELLSPLSHLSEGRGTRSRDLQRSTTTSEISSRAKRDRIQLKSSQRDERPTLTVSPPSSLSSSSRSILIPTSPRPQRERERERERERLHTRQQSRDERRSTLETTSPSPSRYKTKSIDTSRYTLSSTSPSDLSSPSYSSRYNSNHSDRSDYISSTYTRYSSSPSSDISSRQFSSPTIPIVNLQTSSPVSTRSPRHTPSPSRSPAGASRSSLRDSTSSLLRTKEYSSSLKDTTFRRRDK